MAQADGFFRELCGTVKNEFDRDRAVLSFREYLALALDAPRRHLRCASQYVVDVFDYFGSYEKQLPWGKVRRFKLFDGEFDEANIKVAGHEDIQNEVYQLLRGFGREGRTTKLILLHGPNGSAKSSFIDAIFRGMEHYSNTDEGCLYRISWVFPSDAFKKSSIGFREKATREGRDQNSYAHLTGDHIEALLPGELNEHPLMLVPRPQRRALLSDVAGKLPPDFAIPEVMLRGELTPRSHAVFNALLLHYGGDYEEVLRHVRVERFRVSRQYRQAAASVEPQMSVDAGARQITMDQNIQRLPHPLANLSLFDLSGPVVDANRGMLEFNDILKRPIDAFKYLLTTCETGKVAIDPLIVQVDAVFIGSANAMHIDAFKEYPDFQSFKGRIELVQAPYLLRASEEAEIYAQRMRGAERLKPVAPHTFELVAMWGVLTRLLHTQGGDVPETVRKMAQTLTPLEKLRLYDTGETPQRLSSGETRELTAVIGALRDETRGHKYYEGRVGASPRELHAALLAALHNDEYATLSPIAVAHELRALCADPTVYEFLRIEPQGEFLRPVNFIGTMLSEYLDIVDREVSEALGLAEENRFDALFKRYIPHVTAWARKEKVYDAHTGKSSDPDERLMGELEHDLLGSGEGAAEFRNNFMARIASWRIDNPKAPIEFPVIFPRLFRRLQERFFEQKKAEISKAAHEYLTWLDEGEANFPAKDGARMRQTQAALAARGYDDPCAREVISLLLRERYQE